MKNISDYKDFFGRSSDKVARDLIGRLLIRTSSKGITAGKITEVGAYEGGKEMPSRNGMKYAPGCLYLMSRRGNQLFNIATDREGFASCVEIREMSFHDRVVHGPGAISKYLEITKDLDGIYFGFELQISEEIADRTRIKIFPGESDNCLGYFTLDN